MTKTLILTYVDLIKKSVKIMNNVIMKKAQNLRPMNPISTNYRLNLKTALLL